MRKINRQGFTLIELLIVMAIISIIAAVVFVALDPLTRFRQSRDAARWTDISGIVSAIKIDQVDNGGSYMDALKNVSEGGTLVDDKTYMIVDGTAPADCTHAKCPEVANAADCVNMAGLVTDGYLGKVPVSPSSAGVIWKGKDGTSAGVSGLTGYTITKSPKGILTVKACEAESTTEIKVAR